MCLAWRAVWADALTAAWSCLQLQTQNSQPVRLILRPCHTAPHCPILQSQTIAAATQGLDPEWSPLLIMILGVADLLPGCERGSQAWADASPLVYELRRADAGVRVNNVKALRIE